MNINNLKVEIDPRSDANDNIFYLGKLKFPGTLDFSKGITFLVFNSEDGDEELQIAVNDKENTSYSKFSKKRDRLEVRLDARTDQHNNKFYIAKLQYNGYIDCSSEVVFLIFVSREGSEEIQIVGNILQTGDRPVPKKKKEAEIISIPNRARLRDEE